MDMGNSCTGATGPAKEHLAKYRVEKSGCLNIFTMQMDPDQRVMRRTYLRKVLLPYERFANLSNDDLDAVRLCSVEGGYLLEDAEGHEFYLKSSGVTDSEREFRRTYAMMPFEFMDVAATDFKWDKYSDDIRASKELVNRYIVRFPQFKERGMGLYIYSVMKGSGKTMLACCLLNEIAKRYTGSVKFINILDFLEMTKKGFKGDDRDVQAIHRAGLLVVDDIGVQLDKEWIGTVLYQLVNERYANRLPTIYTSNIPPEHLKLDDRITDRIESTTFAVKLPEESIRREMRQQDKKRLLEEIENAP